MTRNAFEERVEAAKRATMGQVLMKAARLFNEQTIEMIRHQGFPSLRPAHTTLFPHLEFGGIRLTELARRVGVTKQAVGQLVGELEAMGLLTRVPDSLDGRAKLVKFTEKGRKNLFRGLAALKALEGELAQEVGEGELAQLHELLQRLLEALEAREGAIGDQAPGPPGRGR